MRFFSEFFRANLNHNHPMNCLILFQTLLIIILILNECQSIKNQSKQSGKVASSRLQNVGGGKHSKKSPSKSKTSFNLSERNDFGQAQPPFQPISAFYQNQQSPINSNGDNNNNRIFIDPPPSSIFTSSLPIPSLPSDFKSALPPLPDFADVLPPPIISDIDKATAFVTTDFGGHRLPQQTPFIAGETNEQLNKASNQINAEAFAQAPPPPSTIASLSNADYAPPYTRPAYPMPEPSFETSSPPPMKGDPGQPFIFDFSPTQPLVQPVPVTQTVPVDRIVPIPYAVPVVHNVLVPQPFEVIRNVPIPQIIPVMQRVYVDRPVLIEKKVPIKLRPPKYYLKKFYGPPKQLAGGLKRKFKNYYKDKLKPIYRRSRRIRF